MGEAEVAEAVANHTVLLPAHVGLTSDAAGIYTWQLRAG